MERAIVVHWKTYDFGKTVVCVDLKDAEDGKIFGFVFETKNRRKPADNDSRMRHWLHNVSSQMRGQVMRMIGNQVLEDLQITTGYHSLADFEGYETFTLDDINYKSRGTKLFEAWQKLEESKKLPIPPHWPLSGRKTTPEVEVRIRTGPDQGQEANP